MKYCVRCGAQMAAADSHCPRCGVPQAVPVVTVRPSATSGPLCPRCSSPYVNFKGRDHTQGANAGCNAIGAIIAGIVFWPAWAYVAMYRAPEAPYVYACHTCGADFSVPGGPGTVPATKAECDAVARKLLIAWIIAVGALICFGLLVQFAVPNPPSQVGDANYTRDAD